jgi:hypothetical protein
VEGGGCEVVARRPSIAGATGTNGRLAEVHNLDARHGARRTEYSGRGMRAIGDSNFRWGRGACRGDWLPLIPAPAANCPV